MHLCVHMEDREGNSQDTMVIEKPQNSIPVSQSQNLVTFHLQIMVATSKALNKKRKNT